MIFQRDVYCPRFYQNPLATLPLKYGYTSFIYKNAFDESPLKSEHEDLRENIHD